MGGKAGNLRRQSGNAFGTAAWGLASALFFAFAALPAAASTAPTVVGADALRALLGQDSPRPRTVLLFSPSDHLVDLFLALHEEGRVGALTVVAPAEEAFTPENLAAWRSHVSRIAPAAENSFSLRDGAIAGEVAGMKVSVVPVRDWRGSPEADPIVLDLAFLFAMYTDEVRTPFLELPRKFLATLDDRKADIARVVPWTASREDVPLAWGYVHKLLGEMVRNPDVFRRGLPGKWAELRQGEYLAYLAAFERAIPHFDSYLEAEPEDPAVLYRIAMMHFIDRAIERGVRYLHRASAADGYYVRGYERAADYLLRERDPDAAERIARAGLLSAPSDPGLNMALARVLLEQARKLFRTSAPQAESRFAEALALTLPDGAVSELRAEWERSKSALSAPGQPGPRTPPGHPRF